MLTMIDMIGQSGTRALEHAAMRAKAKSPKQMNVVIVDSLTHFATSLVYHGVLLLKYSSSNIHGGNKLKRPNLPFGPRSYSVTTDLRVFDTLFSYLCFRIVLLCSLCVSGFISMITSSNEPTPLALFQNPLYFHPSNRPSSLTVQEKLTGAQNYRACRREIEIGLSTKRELGFIKGTVVNHVFGTASEIWQQLEKCFSLNDGSTKYKLNKDTYEITQFGSSIREYYTKMKCVWEELDNINVLPVLAVVTPEILVYLVALNKKKEEQRLFQFLNGLEDHFSHQRSQILMIDPLPSVENACSLLQQEDSQRLLFKSSSNMESSALLSKGIVKDKCIICGFKWHPPEKCWEKVGYPSWHSKYKGPQQSRQSRSGQSQGQGRNQNATRIAAHVESSNISFTLQQELLKEWGVLNNKPYKLPMDHNLKLQADVGTPLSDPESPTSVHMQAVKHVLRYLLNSPDQGILLGNDSAVQVKAYCDSDWASCPMTRRSTTGYCCLLRDPLVSWKSKKQVVVSRSSAEVEYRAMALICYEVNWFVSLLKDRGIKNLEPVDLFYDNQAALYIAANPVFHARTKHIEVDCHYVRDQLKAGIIKPSYVHTKS
ncbi:serine carboxypeptidase S28 family protein [Tanacetum coccineum]